ncbi:hypothetical protein HDV06_004386 [Boothiomyces sp. JEL0866]|nr:hypothetical protein HDV06_004386 [Boothiomyces sp. JEL0866]
MVNEPTNIIVGNIPMVLAANHNYYIGNSCYFDSNHDISRKNIADFNTCSSKCDDTKNCIEFDYTNDKICTLKSGTLIPYYSDANTICSIKVSCVQDFNCLGKAIKPENTTTITSSTTSAISAPTGSNLDPTPSDFPTISATTTSSLSTSIVILIIFLVCFTVITILGVFVLCYRKKSNATPVVIEHQAHPLQDTKLLQPRIVVLDNNDTESMAGTFDSTEGMDEVVSIHEPDTPIVEFAASPDLKLSPFLPK